MLTLTSRISRLYHEALDYPVEDVAVVVTVLAVDTEVLHCLGTLLEQVDVDVSHRSVEDGSVIESLHTWSNNGRH
jgi:ferredoxin-fold anticodon binding domain-containing protein